LKYLYSTYWYTNPIKISFKIVLAHMCYISLFARH
jgi:hypothetical protein